MTQHTSTNPENQVSRRAEIARQLQEAVREADAYNGPGPVSHFRGHGHFDFPDVMTGELVHDSDCPYCRVRKLKRSYGLALHMEGSPHGKVPH
jgi:hypothetical protein